MVKNFANIIILLFLQQDFYLSYRMSYSENNQREQEELYSLPLRAGKRTYFFDVKSSRNGEVYMTLTESKKRTRADGSTFYEKHKIFLYEEDFEKFSDALQNVLKQVNKLALSENHSMKQDIENPEIEPGNRLEFDNRNNGQSNQTVDFNFEDL